MPLENNPAFSWQNRVDGEITADADPDQLFRVILNLCRNAQQAMGDIKDNSREMFLIIDAERQTDCVHIFVRDAGPRHPRTHSGKGFFELFRVPQKRMEAGWGLSIAYELVKAHGGSI